MFKHDPSLMSEVSTEYPSYSLPDNTSLHFCNGLGHINNQGHRSFLFMFLLPSTDTISRRDSYSALPAAPTTFEHASQVRCSSIPRHPVPSATPPPDKSKQQRCRPLAGDAFWDSGHFPSHHHLMSQSQDSFTALTRNIKQQSSNESHPFLHP